MNAARGRGEHDGDDGIDDGIDDGVELLERALAYTRGELVHVSPAALDRPTPCVGWSLDQLLDHMDDALDAFTEGASGAVRVERGRPVDVRVATLQAKACTLLGAWSGPGAPATVGIGGLRVPTGLVVRAAALEIAVHGWDVAQATGRTGSFPDDLARLLRPIARALVTDDDRGTRFAPRLAAPAGADHETQLLAFVGRRSGPNLTGPPVHDSLIHHARHPRAS